MYLQVCYYADHVYLEAFILESIYGLLITAVPFLIMTVLNSYIMCTLSRAKVLKPSSFKRREDTPIRTQFTLILLGVSTCFVCLNLPYFIIWCCHMAHMISDIGAESRSKMAYQNELIISKTLFCCNYCVNFFLYCFSGTFYKKALKKLLQCHDTSGARMSSRFAMRRTTYTSSSSQPMPYSTTLIDPSTSVGYVCRVNKVQPKPKLSFQASTEIADL